MGDADLTTRADPRRQFGKLLGMTRRPTKCLGVSLDVIARQRDPTHMQRDKQLLGTGLIQRMSDPSRGVTNDAQRIQCFADKWVHSSTISNI
jgi:hypothetical protein